MNTLDKVFRFRSSQARCMRPRPPRALRRICVVAAALALSAPIGHAGLPPALYNLGALGGGIGATINGPGLAAHAGVSMAGGCDVNGDGLPDLLIGAPYAGSAGGGVIYVIYGNATGAHPPASMNDADVSIIGEADGDTLGSATVCAGDVNGDGFDDMLITAPGHTPAGYAYLIYGGSSLPAALSLTTLTAAQGMRIPGLISGTEFGWAAAAGDVNADGFADIVVTAPSAHSSSSNTGQGFVIFGSTTLPASFDLGTLNGSNGFSVSATDSNPEPNGDSVAIGDLDGDGFDEVAIGSRQAFPGGLNDTGTVYVVLGHAGAFPGEIQLGVLDGGDGFAIEGSHAGSYVGTSLSFVANFRGDGRKAIVIGAPATASGTITGSGYVVFGKSTFPAHFSLGTLDGTNGVVFSSPTLGDYTGASVAGVADLNGDGRGDIVLGAPYADFGATDAGGGFVVYGRKPPWPASIDLATLNGATGFRFDGAAGADDAGTAVATAGDQNHDGMHDLLVSSPLADVNGAVNVGQVYLLYGDDLIFADGFDGSQ